jgi:methyl-accepting chemotaxis protein
VTDSSSKVGELVAEITAASHEQAQGIEQINTAVIEMDKVTQSNAANSEESASASEELNAQAEQMKAMVSELVAMVGGAKAERSAVMHTAKAKIHNALEVATPVKKAKNKALAVYKAKEATPDQVIPLDDEDFRDF